MKMITDLNKLAKEIIEQNQYMTLATSDNAGNPWVSPVVYAYDKDCNSYFVSIPISKDCLNMSYNNNIAVAIFDSRQKLGEGVGLQTEGKVKEVKISELPKTALIYFKRKYPFGKMRHVFGPALKNFLRKRLYRFYKITPSRIWMNDPNSEIDVRVGVSLKLGL